MALMDTYSLRLHYILNPTNIDACDRVVLTKVRNYATLESYSYLMC